MSLPNGVTGSDLTFGREPALYLDVLKSFLVMLAVFLPQWTDWNLSDDVQTWILAVGVAAFGLIKGVKTHPFPVTALTDFIFAIGILAIGLGVNISMDLLSSLIVVVTGVMVLIQRGQISPKQKGVVVNQDYPNAA